MCPVPHACRRILLGSAALLLCLGSGAAGRNPPGPLEALPLDTCVQLFWWNPPEAGLVTVRHGEAGYPATVAEGGPCYSGPIHPGARDSVLVTGLPNDRRVYFSLFFGTGAGYARADTTSAVPVNFTAHYVDPDGADRFPYLSPADAARTLRAGLSVLSPGDSLFIAPHVYRQGAGLENIAMPADVTLSGLGGRPQFGEVSFPAGFTGSAAFRDLDFQSTVTDGPARGSALTLSGCGISGVFSGEFRHDSTRIEHCTLGEVDADFHEGSVFTDCQVEGALRIRGGGLAELTGCDAGEIRVFADNIEARDLRATTRMDFTGGPELRGGRRAWATIQNADTPLLSIYGDWASATDCEVGRLDVFGHGAGVSRCRADVLDVIGSDFGAAVSECEAGAISVSSWYADANVRDCRAATLTVTASSRAEVSGCVAGALGVDLDGFGGLLISGCRAGSIDSWANDESQTTIEACTVTGPVRARGGSFADLTECTVAGRDSIGLSVWLSTPEMVRITRCIVTGFTVGVAIRNAGVPFTASCNDVWNCATGWWGIPDPTGTNGNFSQDPLFCDAPQGDFHLDAASPCLPGNHPAGVNCGLIGSEEEGCSETPVEPAAATVEGLILGPARPNPSGGATVLSFGLPAAGPVEISIFDAGGREVRHLPGRTLPAGTHTASWDGCDDAGHPLPSGVYLARVRAGQSVRTLRLVRAR